MSKKIFFVRMLILILLFAVCCSAYSCDKKYDGTYLDGIYTNSDLNAGYVFFPDGTGYQFISQEHFLMEYEISEGIIKITTLLKDSKVTKSFPFEKNGDNIVIDGVVYSYIPDDTSGGSQSVQNSISGISAWQTIKFQTKKILTKRNGQYIIFNNI